MVGQFCASIPAMCRSSRRPRPEQLGTSSTCEPSGTRTRSTAPGWASDLDPLLHGRSRRRCDAVDRPLAHFPRLRPEARSPRQPATRTRSTPWSISRMAPSASIDYSWAWPDGLMNGYRAALEIVGTRPPPISTCATRASTPCPNRTTGGDTHLWPEINGRIVGDLADEIAHFVEQTSGRASLTFSTYREAFDAIPGARCAGPFRQDGAAGRGDAAITPIGNQWLTFLASGRVCLRRDSGDVRSMPADKPASDALTAISTHERATPSLVYRSLLTKHPRRTHGAGRAAAERAGLARQLKTSRTAVRSALAMMERQGLIHRSVGSGTFLAEELSRSSDDGSDEHRPHDESVPSFVEIVEGRLLFEPAMMHLVVTGSRTMRLDAMRATLAEILHAPTWHDFKERIYALHAQMFAATKNKFLIQIMESILADRRAVLFDGKDTDKPAPEPVRGRPTRNSPRSSRRSRTRNGKQAEALTATT